MAVGAVSRIFAGMAGAALLVASPAGAQMYSDGYKFLEAVKDKDGEVATELLEAPGSTVVNARDLASGQTGLHYATQRRDLTWIRFLTQEGANPNIRDKQGISPLMVATQLGFVEGVEALISAGARVDVANDAGETPLIYAVHSGNSELLRVLLENGADPDRADNSGRTAREYAELSSRNMLDAIERHAKPESERAGAQATYGPEF